MGEDRHVLLLGGLGGLLGGALFILATIILVTFTPPPGSPEEFLMRYPDLSGVFFVYQRLAFAGVLLLVPLFLGWSWSLRQANKGFSLLGGVLGVSAVLIFAVIFAIQLTSTPILSALYEEAATPEERASVVAAYSVQFGMVFGTAFAGLLFSGVGIISLGIAMLGSAEYQRGFAWLTLVLGVVVIVPLVLGVLNVVARFPLLVLAPILGWKLYSLSRRA